MAQGEIGVVKQPDWQRLAEAVVFILIGVAILLLIPSQVAATPSVRTRTSPAFIPRVVAVLLIAAGVAMLVVAFAGREKQKQATFERQGTMRVVAAMLLLLAYSMLFATVGFVVTSALFLAVFSVMFGARSVFKIAAAAVCVPIVVWLLFEYVFRVPLPHGLLF